MDVHTMNPTNVQTVNVYPTQLYVTKHKWITPNLSVTMPTVIPLTICSPAQMVLALQTYPNAIKQMVVQKKPHKNVPQDCV